MKRLTALLLALLLLCGCGAETAAQARTENETAVKDTAENTEAAQTSAEPEQALPELETAGEETAAEANSEPVWRYPMGIDGDITAELAVCTSLRSVGTGYLLHLNSQRGDAVTFYSADLLLNGSCCMSETMYKELKPGEELWIQLDTAAAAAAMLQEQISTFECTLHSLRDDFTFTAELTPEPEIALRAVPMLGAYAGEQVLTETDSVRVSLLFLGSLLGGSRNDSLYGLIRTENLSGDTIPFKIQQAVVNGIALSVYADSMEIPGETEAYVLFEISGSVLSEAGILGISSVSLQIMTDYAENTGAAGQMRGGSRYEIVLDSAAAGDDSFDAGTVIWSQKGIEIGFLQVENPYDNTLYWRLAVTNCSGDDISLKIIDVTVDGTPEEHCWLNSDAISSGASAYRYIGFSSWAGSSEAPELNFRVQVLSGGRGRILYTSEETTTIPAQPLA